MRQLLALSVYWLGIQTIWGGLNTIVIPQRVDALNPGAQGVLLALVIAVGAVAPIIVQPTIGMISDYTVTRWGRRKPYIVAGTVLDLVFLAGFAMSSDVLAMLAFYFLLQLSSNLAQGPFQGYVPDLVPARQVGTASGLMGLMLVLGTVVGVGIATLGGATSVPGVIALGAVEAVTMVLLVSLVDEGRAAPPRPASWMRIARSAWDREILHESNVLWLLLVRLLFLGAYNVTTLATPYFERVHGLSDSEANATVFLATIIVGVATLVAAVPGGRLSDRYGRRRVIWAAGAIAGIGLLAVAAAPSRELAIAGFVPVGMGMGVFLSADWALMADVIPKHTSGRYMGVLNAGTAMAGPVFLLVGGPTQDIAGALLGREVGPRFAILVAALFVAGACLALRRVDPRRRELEAPIG